MKLYTTPEFSKASGVSEGALRRWIGEGRLIPEQYIKGKKCLYSDAQLQAPAVLEFKARTTKRTAPVVFSLNDRVERIKKLSADTTRSVIEIGKHLTICKAEIPHGDWDNWLQNNFQWTRQTANNFMRIYERFGDLDIDAFKPSTLQILLSLPADKTQDFIEAQADARQPVETQSARQLKENVKQWKQDNIPVTDPNQLSLFDDDSATSGEGKCKNVFTFEGDKPHNDAVYECSQCSSEQSADVIDVEADIVSEIDSPVTVDSNEPPAQNSEPVNDTDAAPVEPARVSADHGDEPTDNLAEVFKLILEVNDADKLRRIRDFVEARLAAVEVQKNKPAENNSQA